MIAKADIVRFKHVTVTEDGLLTSNKRYSLESIRGVNRATKEPNRVFPVMCMLFGLALLTLSGLVQLHKPSIYLSVSVFSILLGLLAWITPKTEYSLLIDTHDGPHEVLVSYDASEVDALVNAIHRAKLKYSEYQYDAARILSHPSVKETETH